MSGKIVRERFMRRLAGMEKYNRLVAWGVVASYLGQIVLAIGLGGFLLGQPATVWSVLTMIILPIFIGTRLRGLNNIVHECVHFTFSSHRNDNVILGSLCASTVMSSFHDYRDEHLSHHAHLGDYEQDLDLQGIEDLRLHEPLTRENFLRHLTNPFLGRHLPYYLGANLSGRDGVLFKCYKLSLIAFTVVGLLFAPMTTLLFVVLPYAFIYSTLNYWTDCLDHAGLVGSEDELDASRNVLAPYLLRILFFPRNDCFHLVHHLFPQVPARHLEATHKLLSEDPIYQQKQHAIRPALNPGGAGNRPIAEGN